MDFGPKIQNYRWKCDARMFTISIMPSIWQNCFDGVFVSSGDRAGINEAISPRCPVAPILGMYFTCKWKQGSAAPIFSNVITY